MVVNLFFRQIKALAIDSLLPSINIVITIDTYFDFNKSSAEIEAEMTADKSALLFFRLRTSLASGLAISTDFLFHSTYLIPDPLTSIIFVPLCIASL